MARAKKLAVMVALAAVSASLMQAEAALCQAVATKKQSQALADGAADGMLITIRGTCVDERDRPIAAARIRVFRYPSRLDPPLLVADLRCDREGTFVVEEVSTWGHQAEFADTGDLCIAATTEGRASTIRWLNKDTLRSAAVPIDPFAPRPADPYRGDILEITLKLGDRAGTLSGTVRDETGQPLAGVTVSMPFVYQQPLPGVQSAVTDAAGWYAIPDIKRWPMDDSDDAVGDNELQSRSHVTRSYSSRSPRSRAHDCVFHGRSTDGRRRHASPRHDRRRRL